MKQLEQQKQNVLQPQQQIISDHKFKDEISSDHLLNKLQNNLKLECMTQIQYKSYKQIKEGKDCLIQSSTGSGKTLSFLIPLLENILKEKDRLTRKDFKLLIVSPTRELSLQTSTLLQQLINGTTLVLGSLSGGMSKDSEKQFIRKGVNIICATPGRLQDHIHSTANLQTLIEKCQYIVIDECDEILQQNFTSVFRDIIKLIPANKKVQKIFVSATISQKVQQFCKQFLQTNYNFISVSTQTQQSIFQMPNTLIQQWTLVTSKIRLATLILLLAENHSSTIVFVESKAVVNWLADILVRIHKQFGFLGKIYSLHGDIKQEFRNTTVKQFLQTGGILISSDVAARGLNLGNQDLSGVEMVIHYDLPSTVEQYVHRSGRAARTGQQGKSILFVMPNEIGLIKLLINSQGGNSQLMQYLSSENIGKGLFNVQNPIKLAEKIQGFLEQQVEQDKDLKNLSILAFQAYISGYRQKEQQVRQQIDFHQLHLGHAAKSFCLNDPPKKLMTLTEYGLQKQEEKQIKERASLRTQKDMKIKQQEQLKAKNQKVKQQNKQFQ